MDSDTEQIKEVYAHYGLAMFAAQGVERTLSMLLACQYGAENITRWIYDDRIAENFNSTFGTLANKFLEFAKARDIAWADEVKEAAEKRNWLAHHYFWIRAVEFCSPAGRSRMVVELLDLISRFDDLDKKLSALTRDFREAHGITDEELRRVEQQMLSGEELVFSPQRLDGPLRIVAAYRWYFEAGAPSRSMLLFKTEAGQNVVLSDRGLCRGPDAVQEKDLKVDTRFDGILPAEVNPKPKGAGAWNYRLTFDNRSELRVEGRNLGGRFTYRVHLSKKVSG